MSGSRSTGGASVLASHRRPIGSGSRGRSPHRRESVLVLRDRQRVRGVNVPLLRRIVRSLLDELFGGEDWELCVHIVAEPEMVRINRTFMRHAGSTDVIAFNHLVGRATRISPVFGDADDGNRREACSTMYGEIFVCMNEAVTQARRFRTSWQSELARYVVHGLLHLSGFDDRHPLARRRMKREEDRLVADMAARFPLSRLARKPTIQP